MNNYFKPNDYTKLLSDVLTALSSSLWGTKMYKLKLVSKYLSTIQEKENWMKVDFSLVSEMSLN